VLVLCRFLTGAGIGGEYSAINSAIDELMPARNRGAVRPGHQRQLLDGFGALGALLLLNESIFAPSLG
jgi:MFS family permease